MTVLLFVAGWATQESRAQATSTSRGASGRDTIRATPASNDSTPRVMLDDVWLAPPYVFEVRDRAIWINGQLAVPAPPKAPPIAFVPERIGVRSTPRSRLLNRVIGVIRESHAPTVRAKLMEAIALVRKSRLVTRAYLGSAGSSITITWKGDGGRDGMTEVIELGWLALSDADRERADSLFIERHRAQWERAVNVNHAMLLVGRHSQYVAESFNFQRVRAEIEALQRGDSTSDYHKVLPDRMRDEILARERQKRRAAESVH